ncbi:MAG: OmpA family protein [Pseudomonadota bacterium]
MRLSSYIPAVAVLIGAAILCLAVAVFAASRIETNSYRSIERALLVDGHDWAEVSVNGLAVTLRGTAPDEATRFQALTTAGTVVDGSRIADQMEVAAAKEIAPPRFSIEILRNDAGVSLIGLVPAAMDRSVMADEVARLVGGAPVTDLLESADYPVPGGWAQAIDFALNVLGQLPRSKISVAADRVDITSVAESNPAKRMLESELSRAAPEGISLGLNISAPRPVITPFTLRFVIDDEGSRFDACSAYSDAGRDRILAAARDAGLQGRTQCVLGLGVPSPQWADAVTAGIAQLAYLGGGSITYSDADVSLVALESTDQAVFERVVGELETALPDVFSLTATKPEPVVVDGTGEANEDGTPEFVATLSPEGALQLRGRVSDERQRSAVSGFAMARFPAADVAPAMLLDDGLPDGWAARVFAGLEALSVLSNGALVVQPDYVALRGDTGSESARGEVSRILSAQLGDAANFDIAVTYVEALDPLVSIPTPEECVASLNDILQQKKVTFEPGSADIDGEGLTAIDRLAEVIEDCADVPMEIAGYTDSQGRETMNLNLSQQRAESVLAALQARRVLTGNLRPKGYGEVNPIADNETEEGREANRRIEFTLIVAAEASDADADGETEAGEDDAETEGADGQN